MYKRQDEGSATAIAFSGTAASVSGAGVSVSGNCVTITSPGTYVLTGTLEEGQLIVDAGKEDVVRLVLNGVSMHCSTSSPLYAKQAGKTEMCIRDRYWSARWHCTLRGMGCGHFYPCSGR